MFLNLTEISLSRWIDLTVDGYKHALVKEGNPPEQAILQAEYTLRIQYADAIGDNEYKMYCNAVKEISRLEITLAQINSLIDALREAFVEPFARELNRLLHSSIYFNVQDSEAYDKALSRASNRSKGIKLNIDLKKIAAKKLEEKYNGSNGGKLSREYYLGILIELSDAAGYQVTDSISVFEFCERIKKLNRQHELINMKQSAKNIKNG